jgi:transcription antitermination factor NusG
LADWYAIAAKPTRELQARDELLALDLPAYCPLRRVRLHRRGCPSVSRAYFPGYLFADCAIDGMHKIRRARQVLGVLGSCPIPFAVIMRLQASTDPWGFLIDAPLPGRSFHLDRPGAIGMLIATVQQFDNEQGLRVSVRMFGQECRSRLGRADLEGQAIRPE